MNKIKQI